MQDAPYAKPCRECGAEMVRPTKRAKAQWAEQKFCSPRCRTQARRIPQPSKVCERCGEVFTKSRNLTDRQWALRRFCTFRCFGMVDPVPPLELSYELAWAVGLYEGEGSTGVYGERPRAIVSILSTDRDALEHFERVVSMGAIHERKVLPRGATKPQYVWCTSKSAEIAVFLEAAWSFLSERRKAQAAPVLAHCQGRIYNHETAP